MISYDFRFNSKLVRLKGYPASAQPRGKRSFNSKLVRLKGGDGEFYGDDISVSIPNWCD